MRNNLKGEVKMNKEIKERIEKYVMDGFDEICVDLDTSHDEYWRTRELISKDIKGYIEILQKEDVRISTDKFNGEKNKLDSERISLERETNMGKIECENRRNEISIQIENRKIDSAEIKNNNDSDLKEKEIKIDIDRNKEARVDRLIKICIDGATIMIPIFFYGKWMKRGFIFEETGTFTSSTFKNLFSKFKPTK